MIKLAQSSEMANNISLILWALAALFLNVNPAQPSDDSLPTNYEYYAGDRITSGLNADRKKFKLNDKEITIFSGAFHYFRVHPSQWRDRLRKMRAAGLNTIETYVPWNLHEYQSGHYDFGQGGSDFEEFLDVATFIEMAAQEDLFVLVRAGPYICSEFEFGGLPSWLLRSKGIKIRTDDAVFVNFVARFWGELLAVLDPLQFTKGGPIIAFQVENEYGNTGNSDPAYLRALVKIYRDNGIKELLYTSDPPGAGTRGALPNELLMTANFNQNPSGNLNALDKFQDNKPTMAMEYWSGWFDHVTEDHHTVPTNTYSKIYEEILAHPASVNIYMFVGSTNFGFTNGANLISLDNSGLQPDVTSYDYDAPISEAGEITEKYAATANLIAKYSAVKTKLPAVPSTPARVVFDDIKITEQILLSEIIDAFPNKIASEKIVSMEQLPINNNSGQSFGYVVYRKTNLSLNPNDVLKITGHVRDHVLVLLNGKLLNPVLASKDDLNKFGYWRLKDSTLTLTGEKLSGTTLDLVVENNARNNFGSLDQFHQFKGLIEDVLINDEVISNWQIVPLEFKRSWNKRLSNWHDVYTNQSTPALYKVTFNATAPLSDTYINVQEWRKGIAIVNGFVLGRIFAVGPQQALYLPAGFLREGKNELVIFEHFTAPEYVKFSAKPIWGVGTFIGQ